jgi:hypothetical protein
VADLAATATLSIRRWCHKWKLDHEWLLAVLAEQRVSAHRILAMADIHLDALVRADQRIARSYGSVWHCHFASIFLKQLL